MKRLFKQFCGRIDMSAKGHIKGVNTMFDNLTKSDIEKMQEEIEYRKLVVRKEALEAVKEARAHGGSE